MARFLMIHATLLVGLASSVSVVAARDNGGVLYVESDAAGRPIGQARIASCVRMLEHEMGIEGKPLPTIVVIHVSTKEADRAGLKKVAAKLRVNYDQEKSGEQYYELWLVGNATTYDYVYSLHYLLGQHFGLHEPEAHQRNIIARVVRWMDATVSTKK